MDPCAAATGVTERNRRYRADRADRVTDHGPAKDPRRDLRARAVDGAGRGAARGQAGHRHQSDHRRDAGCGDREADRPAQRGGSPAHGEAEKIRDSSCSLLSKRPIQGRWRAERRRPSTGCPDRIGDARSRIVKRRHNGVRFGAAPAEELRLTFRRRLRLSRLIVRSARGQLFPQEISSALSRYSTTLASD
jgi:hypothetical protein